MKKIKIYQSDFDAWFVCQLQYLNRRIGAKRSKPSMYRVIGDATHEAAAAENISEREAIVAKHLARLPEAERLQAKVLMVTQIEVADRQEDKEIPVRDLKREKTERWPIAGTNREFVIKTDKIGWITDSSSQDVLQITDLKCGLNPEWLIWYYEMQLGLAKLTLKRKEENLASVKTRVFRLEAEAGNLEGNTSSAVEKKLSYQKAVLATESAKTADALVIVKKLVAVRSSLRRKLERIRTQLFFFGMVAEKTRDYHFPSRLVAQFLGEVHEPAHVETLKQEALQSLGFVKREPATNRIEFWYRPEYGRHMLERYLASIPLMEAVLEAKSAEPTTGNHCKGCDYRDTCEAFQTWSNWNSSMSFSQLSRTGNNILPDDMHEAA